jgi:hypothetical protein
VLLPPPSSSRRQCHLTPTLLREAAYSPVRRRLIQSWNSHTPQLGAFHTPGSFSLSHSALGINHSAETGPRPAPLTTTAGSLVARTRAACSAARMSIQRMAGLKGLRSGCSRSKATTVQQVVSTHMAATESGDDDLAAAAASAPRTATPRACHQDRGSCSARAGAGNVVA